VLLFFSFPFLLVEEEGSHKLLLIGIPRNLFLRTLYYEPNRGPSAKLLGFPPFFLWRPPNEGVLFCLLPANLKAISFILLLL